MLPENKRMTACCKTMQQAVFLCPVNRAPESNKRTAFPLGIAKRI